MCILAIQYEPDTDTPILVASNREEAYDRPMAQPGADGQRGVAQHDGRSPHQRLRRVRRKQERVQRKDAVVEIVCSHG